MLLLTAGYSAALTMRLIFRKVTSFPSRRKEAPRPRQLSCTIPSQESLVGLVCATGAQTRVSGHPWQYANDHTGYFY